MTVRELEQLTLNALKNGNTESYCLCYDLYFKVLCSYSNSIIRDPGVSEEIVQDLFLALWENREKLPDTGSLKAYLFTAVRNDCLDHIKHRKIEKKYAEEYMLTAITHYENIYSELLDKDISRHLDSAIGKLSERCREVFMLSRFHYLSYRDIADKLDISVKTVENQIVNALKILRKELDHLL